MTTTDEQAILDYAYGRLPTNRREVRWVPKDGIFNIGCLARLINLGLVPALQRRLTKDMVDPMVVDVMPLNQSEQVGAFADLTLAAPCLAYARSDGTPVLIDGLKRARQNFALGRSDVPLRVITLDDARRLGMSAAYREHWKVLESVEYHPIGAQGRRGFDKVIVELWDDREDESPGRGQPSLSEQQNALAAKLEYHLISLIEIEQYLRKKHPSLSLIKGLPRRDRKPEWAQKFLRALHHSGMIPFAPTNSEVDNFAGSVIADLTGFKGRAEFKRRAEGNWKQMSSEMLIQERDSTLTLCAAIMKADLRFKIRQTSHRTLVNWEGALRKQLHWKKIHSTVEKPDRYPDNAFDTTRLGFDEQLIVTQITGINMNDVYHDHTNRDALFQAYAFLFGVGRKKQAMADPCMVETIAHRRAMSILGQGDVLSESWEGLFEHWRHVGLTDAVLLDMSRRLDAEQCVYEGREFLFP